MAVQELPKGVDADQLRAMLGASQANFETLEKAWDDLVQKHEGEWVAAYDGQFVFGASIEDVLAEATKRGWSIALIAIDVLRRERADILL